MADFKCVTDTISSIKTTLDEIQTILEDTYAKASNVQVQLTDTKNWAGEAQLVGVAFLDIVVQYHQMFAPGEDGPVAQASQALQNYLDRDAVFYENWDEYQDLEDI